jgi:hypothetical protein
VTHPRASTEDKRFGFGSHCIDEEQDQVNKNAKFRFPTYENMGWLKYRLAGFNF